MQEQFDELKSDCSLLKLEKAGIAELWEESLAQVKLLEDKQKSDYTSGKRKSDSPERNSHQRSIQCYARRGVFNRYHVGCYSGGRGESSQTPVKRVPHHQDHVAETVNNVATNNYRDNVADSVNRIATSSLWLPINSAFDADLADNKRHSPVTVNNEKTLRIDKSDYVIDISKLSWDDFVRYGTVDVEYDLVKQRQPIQFRFPLKEVTVRGKVLMKTDGQEIHYASAEISYEVSFTFDLCDGRVQSKSLKIKSFKRKDNILYPVCDWWDVYDKWKTDLENVTIFQFFKHKMENSAMWPRLTELINLID